MQTNENGEFVFYTEDEAKKANYPRPMCEYSYGKEPKKCLDCQRIGISRPTNFEPLKAVLIPTLPWGTICGWSMLELQQLRDKG